MIRSDFKQSRPWKRRSRTSPTSPATTREELLVVCWNGDDFYIPRSQWNDRMLRDIFCMKTDLTYFVVTTKWGQEVAIETRSYKDQKEALADYRRRCKDFRRSKEVDYGFPLEPEEDQ